MRARVFLVLLVIFTGVLGGQCQKGFAVPEELIGIWVTKDPRYFNTPFEIKKNTVIFEQGLGYLDFEVYPIADVKMTESEGQTLYIIYYILPSGKIFEFSFYYSGTNGGQIRFKNQPDMVWTKKKS